MNIEKYYENPEINHVNCEPNRPYCIPFSDRNQALCGNRKMSDRYIDLNGKWRFKYSESVYEMSNFINDGCCDFIEIDVPSCWQMLGFDRHMYTNVRYPFPFDPPYVPNENPCGAYMKEFILDNKGHESYYLNFEGVDSCFYVWLNGNFVGYSQVSHSTSEFNITDYIKDGKNRLYVLVLKWCDGSYLEDQDKFRMSGIFRDVYILRRDNEHIHDFRITTEINGIIKIISDMDSAEYELFDGDTKVGCGSGRHAEFKVDEPILWSAENPYLYTLVIHCGNEYIVEHVGIREVKIEGNIFLLNGKKIKLKGVNRHDSDPKTGFVISPEQAEKDLRMMKECNINAVRTSHYPNAPWFAQLCDKYGFYVIGESDIEAHGCVTSKGGYDENLFGLIAQDLRFKNAILDRVQRNVQRDINRTCILLWSLGNEAGYGENFENAARWVREYDKTRYIHYEGSVHETGGHKNDLSVLDVYSTMYASPEWIDRYFEDENNTKPYMQCEYIHAMGNGPGGIKAYTDRMDKYDGFFGAFVWEWCDHAIYKGTRNGKDIYYYGGDHGELLHDNNFCMDGMVYPDRRPHTGLYEYKHAIRPVRAELFNGNIRLTNKLAFTNAADYIKLRYTLYTDGYAYETYETDAPSIPAGGSAEINVPENADSILIEYILKKDIPLVNKGHVMGYDMIEINKPKLEADKGGGALNLIEKEHEVTVKGDNFAYKYDKLHGIFKEIAFNGKEFIRDSMEWNIWRAPIDNDMFIRDKWEANGFSRAVSRCRDTKVSFGEDCCIINSDIIIAAAALQWILQLNAEWKVYGNGVISLDVDVVKNKEVPMLPRFGIRMFLDKKFNHVQYFGFGPYESYEDKHEASYRARFDADISELHEDYIKPQENGSHRGCVYTNISSDDMTLNLYGEDFSFNFSEYTQEELGRKKHNFELEKAPYNILCVDYRQNGIGSNSCGPEPAAEFKLENDFNWHIEMDFGLLSDFE